MMNRALAHGSGREGAVLTAEQFYRSSSFFPAKRAERSGAANAGRDVSFIERIGGTPRRKAAQGYHAAR